MIQNHLLIELVETSLASDGDSETVNVQLPDEGFFVIAYKPTMYDTNGAVLEAEQTRRQVTVTIRDKNTGGVVYCEGVDIYALDRMHDNPLWKGQFFTGGKNVSFTFTRTTTGAALSGALSIDLQLIGYRGPFPTPSRA